MNHSVPFVLASKSPRRRALLNAAGLHFEVDVAQIDESAYHVGRPPEQAQRTASAKAAVIAESGRWPYGSLLLAADTMVVLDDTVYNKPKDAEEARLMLSRLAGRTHQVLSAITFGRVGSTLHETVVATEVEFNPVSAELIEDYVASGEPMDKAGSYGIQGLGARLVARVHGDITGVIGLPMRRLNELHHDLTGQPLFQETELRRIAFEAFPDLAGLPETCIADL